MTPILELWIAGTIAGAGCLVYLGARLWRLIQTDFWERRLLRRQAEKARTR